MALIKNNINNKINLTDDPDYYNKWYHNHKDKVLNKLKEKVICECGLELTKSSIRKHKMTKIHKSVMLLIPLKK